MLSLSFSCQSSLWGLLNPERQRRQKRSCQTTWSLAKQMNKLLVIIAINRKRQSTWNNSWLRAVSAFSINQKPFSFAASLFWLSNQQIVTTIAPSGFLPYEMMCAFWKLKNLRAKSTGRPTQWERGEGEGYCSLTPFLISHTDTMVKVNVQLNRRADTQTRVISLKQEKLGRRSQLSCESVALGKLSNNKTHEIVAKGDGRESVTEWEV